MLSRRPQKTFPIETVWYIEWKNTFYWVRDYRRSGVLTKRFVINIGRTEVSAWTSGMTVWFCVWKLECCSLRTWWTSWSTNTMFACLYQLLLNLLTILSLKSNQFWFLLGKKLSFCLSSGPGWLQYNIEESLCLRGCECKVISRLSSTIRKESCSNVWDKVTSVSEEGWWGRRSLHVQAW